MATQNELTSRENLLLAAKMSHNNEIIDVAEVLNETNDVVQDAVVQQANDITSHVISRRTALPASSVVKVGEGWEATVGRLQQVRETIMLVKARYQCPQDVMRLQANPAKYRMQQERAYIESMGQSFSNYLIGDATNEVVAEPEEFEGFALRYGTLASNSVITNGASSGGGSTISSIYFVQWGAGKCYLIYPRNTEGGGIRKTDKGLINVQSESIYSATKYLWAYVTEFAWDVGLSIEDTRSVKRLANISTSSSTDSNTLDEDKIIELRNAYKTSGTISMYCNQDVFTQLQILAKDKSNVHWGPDSPFGRPQLYFLDMPVRRCDAILSTEAVIS